MAAARLAAAAGAPLALLLLVTQVAIAATCPDTAAPTNANADSYLLYNTKTMYDNALRALDALPARERPAQLANVTLAEANGELEAAGCQAVSLYYLSRHAARHPSATNIGLLRAALADLQRLLGAAQRAPSGLQGAQNDSLASYLNWSWHLEPRRHDNLLTAAGEREQAAIGRRLARTFPRLFGGGPEVGALNYSLTSRTRTAQTALKFLSAALEDRFEAPEACGERGEALSTSGAAMYDARALKRHQCLAQLRGQHELFALEAHRYCVQIHGKEERVSPEVADASQALEQVRARVAARLGLELGQLEQRLLKAIYDLCRYGWAEVGAGGPEPLWCGLLDGRDLRALEYLEDLKSYIRGAYGWPGLAKQACPLTSHLAQHLEAWADPSANQQQQQQPRAAAVHLGFYHAGTIKRLLAALGLFRDAGSYGMAAARHFGRSGLAPGSRQWRTSLAIPFSANQAFVTYRCPSGAPERLLVAINERVARLPACGGRQVCTWAELGGWLAAGAACDLERACEPPSEWPPSAAG